MPKISSHQINEYYKNFINREIAFNKSIIRVTGLEPKKVFLKIKGEQWSCILYSCSLKNAKVITNMNNQTFQILKEAKNFINLRLSFLPYEHKNSIVFFIPSHVDGYKNFNTNNPNTYIINLSFTKKPPDDFIEIIGDVINEKNNFEKRKDFRINLEGKIIWDIGLITNKSIAVIDNIKRPCIIKNLSVSGALLMLVCNPKFILNKKIDLHMKLIKNKADISIEGIIKRSEDIEGRKDIHGIAIEYDKEKIPIEYKKMLNSYIDKLEEIAKHNK